MTDPGLWTGAQVLWQFGVDSEAIAAGLCRKGMRVTAAAIEHEAWVKGWKRSAWPKTPPVHCPKCGETVVTA